MINSGHDSEAVEAVRPDEPDQSLESELLAQAARIRAIELVLLDLHAKGRFAGSLHTCVGEELIAVALHAHLNPATDAFFATHRGHGHFLAYGGAADALFAELLGREGAACRGRGGSQNLHHGRFFSNGIQGAGCLQAVGYAWALKRAGIDGLAVAQLGDGTLGEGAAYEALNFATLLKTPTLFLVQHNGWSQSTDARLTSVGDILDRVRGFGLNCDRRSDDDPIDLYNHLGAVVQEVRSSGPFVQIIDTKRLMAHSTRDDLRPRAMMDALWASDAIEQRSRNNAAFRARVQREKERIELLATAILERPGVALDDATAIPDLAAPPWARQLLAPGNPAQTNVIAAINAGLHELMNDERVLIIGEDIADPYGGAFKATKDLSTRFPDRVFSTPVAEAAIAGVAVGAALAGYRPIAEMMFSDFVTLATDQLINSAAKYHFTFGGEVTCPLTLRLPSGGGRGYGPTHSQSLERLYCGVPGLRVVALSRRHDPCAVLRQVVLEDEAPVVLVEPKPHYGLPLANAPPVGLEFVDLLGTPQAYPPLQFRPAHGERAAITVVTYGLMTDAVEAAMKSVLVEHETFCDYFVLTQLWPLECSEIANSVGRTGRLLVVEPDVAVYGISAAVVHQLAAAGCSFATRTVGARALPIPSAQSLEEIVLPQVTDVTRALRELLGPGA